MQKADPDVAGPSKENRSQQAHQSISRRILAFWNYSECWRDIIGCRNSDGSCSLILKRGSVEPCRAGRRPRRREKVAVVTRWTGRSPGRFPLVFQVPVSRRVPQDAERYSEETFAREGRGVVEFLVVARRRLSCCSKEHSCWPAIFFWWSACMRRWNCAVGVSMSIRPEVRRMDRASSLLLNLGRSFYLTGKTP